MMQETDAIRLGTPRQKARMSLRRREAVDAAVKSQGQLDDKMKSAIEKEWVH